MTSTSQREIDVQPQPRTPSGQFSLRTILLVVLATAVVCAVAAPYVRALSELRRWLLAGQIVTAFASAAVYLLFFFRRQRRVERLAGGRLLLVPMQPRTSAGFMNLVLLICSIFMLAVSIIVMTFVSGFERQAQQLGDSSYVARHFFKSLLMTASGGMMFALWKYQKTSGGIYGAVEFCENGLAIGTRFHPWSEVRSVMWEPASGYLQWNINRTATKLTIPTEQREHVGRMLKEYVAHAHWHTAPLADSKKRARTVSL